MQGENYIKLKILQFFNIGKETAFPQYFVKKFSNNQKYSFQFQSVFIWFSGFIFFSE
jgi:hypothetical protein